MSFSSENAMNKSAQIFIFLGIFMLISGFCQAQVVIGNIQDENHKAIPYATIFVKETKAGTITNSNGDFVLQLAAGNYHLSVRSMGYLPLEKNINLTADTLKINLVLQIQEFEIKEVKVFPGKEDPAYFIIRKAMAKAAFYREKIAHYEADLYVKSNFVFTNIPKLYQNKIEIEGKKMKEVFKENMTYVIESQNKITFDYPQKYKQEVISKKTSLLGFDEPPVMGLITSSFYEERPNQVISPLSSMALKHYQFIYEGFITSGNFDVFKIRVKPKRNSDELVEGYIYIVDKLWCIYMVDFDTRFEFFKYRIKQQYENLGQENWLPVSHLIEGNLGMLGLKANFYYGASLKYANIEENEMFRPLSENNNLTGDSIPVKKEISKKQQDLRNEVAALSAKEELTNNDVKKVARLNRKILKEQYKDSTLEIPAYNNYEIKDEKDSVRNDSVSWEAIRSIPLTSAELESYAFTDSLVAIETAEHDSLSTKKKTKTLLRKIITGHYDLAKDSTIRFSYNGIISTGNFDFNTVDGYKYKQYANIRFNPDSGKFIILIPEMGYAFNRKAIFASFTSRFSNILWENNSFGFGVGKESRDFKPENLGINAGLNAISSWFFAENYMKLYETTFLKMNMSQRLLPDFYVFANVEYNSFVQLQNTVSFLFNEEKEFSDNSPLGFSANDAALANQKSLEWSAGLNYRKRQRKPWLQKSDFLFLSDFFTANVKFIKGVSGVLSSVSDFSSIDVSFHQQANISPSVGIDWQINTGYFFSAKQMHFSQFKHFKTSEILVPFQSFSSTFQLLNDYEFSTNKSYVNVGGEFRSEYLLLRFLSFLNKRTWSESLHVNYLTTPDLKNYWETAYSLNSLFFAGNLGFFAGFSGTEFTGWGVKISISVD